MSIRSPGETHACYCQCERHRGTIHPGRLEGCAICIPWIRQRRAGCSTAVMQ